MNSLQTATTTLKNIEDEERTFDAIKKLVSGATFVGKVNREDGTFTDKFVKTLVDDKRFRTKHFDEWVKRDPDGSILSELVGSLTSKNRKALVDLYASRLKELS
ncbi:unnamed protein product [Phytophthora fragariaefolia]|uniref:Unnamed protein product n=1 Tax=Phytophthora fragariaefolia TaxID=1490495 RepID=A0A9W6Y5N5_9STRA|nr:unnamed protein product [Phytophthora fragariaefolia]